MTITEQALDLAPKDAEVIPGVHVPGFTGQGWSSHETMLIVRWLFAHPDAWDQAMAVARDPKSNPHTVADTLHEKLVPRSELDAIAAQGFDPAKVNWLEVAHELIERRGDPKPAAVSLAAQAAADGPDDPAAAMATARHLHDTGRHLTAASRHLDAAREAPAGDPDGHISETTRHLDGAHASAHDLAAHLRAHYPAEGADLDALCTTIGLAGIAAQALNLTGDGHGHHIPGTPDVYRHGWEPVTGTETGSDGIRRPAKAAVKAAPAPGNLIGQYAQWHGGLTDAEDKALRFYQSPGFALMNGQLRGVGGEDLKRSEHATDTDLKRASKAIKDLKGAIAKAPPLRHDTTVYRGFDAGQFGELKPGKIITDPGFVSTSVTNDAGAVGRAKSAGQMKLTLPAGTKAAAGSVRELVLPPGSSMRITSVTTKGGVTHVQAELIPPGASLAADDGEGILLAASVSRDAKTATTAHLTQTICNHLGHTIEHTKAMGDDPDPKVRKFNADHARTHLDGALEHVGKLTKHLRSNYPEEGKRLAELKAGGTASAQMAEPASIAGQMLVAGRPKAG